MNDKKKTGRNEPCPCGSGKKFKKCHGGMPQPKTSSSFNPFSDPEVKMKVEQMKAAEIQREKQQGKGRGIISNIFKGYRLVAVGNRYYWDKSENWKTFHDFLSHYVRSIFGQEWADIELKKEIAERHPLVQWYDSLCKEQKKAFRKKGELFETSINGAIFGFTTLAYNLYLIAHNIHLVHGEGLHKRLVERLRNKESFYPAFYETMVTASFIKAGFSVELEDEEDSTVNHAEFTATSSKTGNKYSVEAKHRQMGKKHTAIRNQLFKALKKELPHERVVFINLNIPDNITGDGRLKWLDDVICQMRDGEETITVKGEPAPPAYVFVTNHPFLYNLDTYQFSPAVVGEGFKIPDFKIDSSFQNLREALNSREKHIDMLDLIKAMKEYDEIPSTFDGEIAEYAFGDIKEPRLKVGNKYILPSPTGKDIVATLRDVVVMERERKTHELYDTDDGKQLHYSGKLTDEEFIAFKKHPDTFFGVYKKHDNRSKDALDFYDFCYRNYKKTTKEKLLEFLKDHPNLDKFREMPQEELAKVYCEILTYSAMPPTPPSSAPEPHKL